MNIELNTKAKKKTARFTYFQDDDGSIDFSAGEDSESEGESIEDSL